MAGRLHAGVARRAITPPAGTWMLGYANRDRAGSAVHDELYATALALDDGRSRVVVVTCDLVFLHPEMVSEIRSRLTARTGVPAERIMLCCSHTHSGPATWRVGPPSDAPIDRYLERLADQICAAAFEAMRNVRPAVWGCGWGEVEIGMNRRQRLSGGGIGLGANPAGPVDRALSVVRVDEVDEQGEPVGPLAVLVHHACHAVCLSSNNYAFSADWPGVMRRQIEAESGALVGFVQGACADINPVGGPQDGFEGALRLGGLAAREALRIYSQIPLSRAIDLRGVRRVLDLPLKSEGAAGERSFADTASAVTGLSRDQALAWLDERFPWSADLCPPRPGQALCARMEVQVLGVGDLALIGLAAEPFVEIGVALKERAPSACALVAGYANGSVGYLATPQAYREGGYEVASSYVYYRLPSPLAPRCAKLVISCALDLASVLC